ncbi:hypothetical protein BDV24DRAFT_166691 [Aspergillus arachidicola]|uniref:Uncharacterized protein n=1 Tax=Aspergillus arachidicola TaxID=656916 RepID=A0A2G7FMH3_9EURO|nr:hypothetical protein BDV24DRAFT_166691 [Aspergillus arachidicola]PIG81842.1 hypothetical protein AARAC_003684 [Aspergillus arachidicola]
MQIYSTVAAATLSLAGTAHAWAQAADGTWIANQNHYIFTDNLGFRWEVAEACTIRNTNTWLSSHEACAYWLDSEGRIARGECTPAVRTSGDPINIVLCE